MLDGLIASAARHSRRSIVLSRFYRGELPELRRVSIGPDLVFGRMIEDIKRWVETESPTRDVPAVNRMIDLVAGGLDGLAVDVRRVPGKSGMAARPRDPSPRGEPDGSRRISSAKNPPINKSQVQTVSIDRVETIRFNNQVVDLGTLTEQLSELKQKNPDIAIVIRPDRELPVQKLIGLMDALQRAGITKLGIATRAEPR